MIAILIFVVKTPLHVFPVMYELMLILNSMNKRHFQDETNSLIMFVCFGLAGVLSCLSVQLVVGFTKQSSPSPYKLNSHIIY